MVAETVVCLLIGLCTRPPVYELACALAHLSINWLVHSPTCTSWTLPTVRSSMCTPLCSVGEGHTISSLQQRAGSAERIGSLWSNIMTSCGGSTFSSEQINPTFCREDWLSLVYHCDIMGGGGAPFHCESLSPPYCSWQCSCLMCSW